MASTRGIALNGSADPDRVTVIMVGMPLPSPRALVQDFDRTTHAERCRRTVQIALDHRQDPRLGELLDALAAESDYHHSLTLLAARAIGDEARLQAATTHPSARVRRAAAKRLPLQETDEEFAELFMASSHADRAILRQRLRREHRTDLADALLRRDLGDHEHAALLAAASADTVRERLGDLADLVPNVRPLAQAHPDAVLDHLAARITDALQVDRKHWWNWVDVALVDLVAHDVDRVLTLLESYGPGETLPHGIERVLASLVRRDPGRIAELLSGPYRAGRLPQAVFTEFARFSPADRIRLAARTRRSPAQLTTLLTALPPSERGAVVVDLFDDRLPSRDLALIDALPRELRRSAVRHEIASRATHRPDTILMLASGLPYAEATQVAAPYLTSSVAEERAAAHRCRLHAAGHDRDPAAWADALTGLDRLANEQDPVRRAAVNALADLPIGHIATGPLDAWGRLADTLVAARDTSTDTLRALQRHCWRAVRWAAENDRGDVVATHVELLDRLTEPKGSLAVPDLTTLPRGAEQLVIDALLPRVHAALRRNDHDLLLSLAGALGRRLDTRTDLSELLERAVRSSKDHTISRAIDLWLENPATRGARVETVLTLERSAVTLASVQQALLDTRQDLLDRCWSRRPPRGRFWRSRSRYVPVLRGRFGRMLPRQGVDYAEALTDLANHDDTTVWQTWAAIATIPRLPGVGLDALTPFLAPERIGVVEAVLAALPRTGDPRALDMLLAHRGDDHARVAAYAMSGAVRQVRPDEITTRLLTLIGPGSKVTAAKEGVRLLGTIRPPGALDALLTAVTPDSHRDVRAAFGRTLRAFLDDDRAWAVLDTQAQATRDEAWAITETSPAQLPVRHRDRFARVVARAVTTHPELLSRAGAWVVWRPELASPLIAQVADTGTGWWSEAVTALATATQRGAPWPPVLALADDLAARALADDQPDAETDRDLPLLQRLTRLCGRLLTIDDDALRPHWAELAQALVRHPSSRRLGLAAAVAAIDPRDPVPGITAVLELATDPFDAETVGALLAEADQLRRMSIAQLVECHDAALARDTAQPGPVAGQVMLQLVARGGSRTSWATNWRTRLRTLRRHPVPWVAEAARQVLTATER
ncbi:hypothetical protein ACQCX2_12900 [Propionibacteriaceae bacterium Y1700]|uniref:hypothetical protein n=1 Tax=Microlunatus sp. Y1700 TaxID=3418487 RepID=UPI003DA789A6